MTMTEHLMKEADRLFQIFGVLAPKVVDELMQASFAGYSYDMEEEIPFYEELKTELELRIKIDKP